MMNPRKFGLLIADDNPKTRENYQEYLTEHPNLRDIWVYDEQDKSKKNVPQVRQAGDAYSALQAIEKFIDETSYPMIVLADAYMPPNCDGNKPEKDEELFGGLKLIDAINKNEKLKERVTVILITFYNDDELIQEYRNELRPNFKWKENIDYYFISKILSREDGLETEEDSLKKLSEADNELREKVFAKTFETINDRVKEFHNNKYPQINILHQDTNENALPKFGIMGNSQAISQVANKIKQVAPTNITVMLQGESGVGKDVVAKAIHKLSERKDKEIVIVNCGAIPEGTIESELFGHEKGAFTGAQELRKGYFEQADGGTIFLDEIGDTPKDIQVKLLRVIESGAFMRVGSSKTEETDIRVIAATNKNLWGLVQEGSFREDLFYRLDGLNIKLPPLRDRPDDILPILHKFVTEFISEYSEYQNSVFKGLTGEAKDLLISYHWPGNIRELRSVAEKLVGLEKSQFVDKEGLQKYLKDRLRHDGSASFGEKWFFRSKKELEKEHIIQLLNYYKYDYSKVEDTLGISNSTLHNKMEKYNIPKKSERNRV